MSSPCQKANTQKILTKIIVNISLQMIANQKPSPYFEKNESLILICVYMFISLCDKDTFYALNEEGTLWHSYIKRLHKIMKPVGGGLCVSSDSSHLFDYKQKRGRDGSIVLDEFGRFRRV